MPSAGGPLAIKARFCGRDCKSRRSGSGQLQKESSMRRYGWIGMASVHNVRAGRGLATAKKDSLGLHRARKLIDYLLKCDI